MRPKPVYAIGAAARREFSGPPAVAARPDHRARLGEYLSDLVRPYRLALREDRVSDRTGHSYGEMAAELIPELVPADQPVGLLVLGFAVPDVRPGRATATYLGELCPGTPLAFAVCDQGSAAGHTALRLAGEYLRTGAERALVLVAEQPALPYDAGLPADLPAAPAAVGLRCEQSGPAAVVAVRQHAGVAPDRVAGLLAGELAATGDGAPVCLVADSWLAGAFRPAASGAGVRLRVVPDGRPHTGGWWELAGALAQPDPAGVGRVVLASYDRQLRYLCMSTVDGALPAD